MGRNVKEDEEVEGFKITLKSTQDKILTYLVMNWK